MSQYFPPYRSSRSNIKVELDLSSFASKTNFANVKTEVDKLDIDKLTPVPNDLTKLSNVVKNDVKSK